MQDMRGKVRRSLRVLAIDAPAGAGTLAGGRLVSVASGKDAGAVTSAAYSQRAGAWLAMAKLQLDAIDAGLRYEGASGTHPARLAEPV